MIAAIVWDQFMVRLGYLVVGLLMGGGGVLAGVWIAVMGSMATKVGWDNWRSGERIGGGMFIGYGAIRAVAGVVACYYFAQLAWDAFQVVLFGIK